MQSHNQQSNFEGLLEAWLDALDIEALNKQFYRKLFAWFEHAVDEARFPTSENPTVEEHIIRLITRLLFIWFIKEKHLVNADLFNEDQIRLPADQGYDRETGDSYYRAILQNLFFATLNTEIGPTRIQRHRIGQRLFPIPLPARNSQPRTHPRLVRGNAVHQRWTVRLPRQPGPHQRRQGADRLFHRQPRSPRPAVRSPTGCSSDPTG